MSYSTLIAVDPGASGAFVVRKAEGTITTVQGYDGLASIERAIVSAANATPAPYRSDIAAVIERVWASPVMGKAACFAFGENYGRWCGALFTAGIHVYCITPQKWQRAVVPNIQGQGDARKNALKQEAIAMFDLPVADPLLPPKTRITLENCDALLLSQFAWRRNKTGEPLGDRIA
jgi:hypothetical protein